VVVGLPIEVQSDVPVNLICARYDATGITIDATGQGRLSLAVEDGEFAVAAGAQFRVTAGDETSQTTAGADGLRLEIDLGGPARITIEPAAG
jgi:hypothetical protein